MWGNKEQARRLIELRKKALEVLGSPFEREKDVQLSLKVYVGIPGWDTLDGDERFKALKQAGDLDNFVAGVCDGLMAAHKNTPHTSLHDSFGNPDNPVYPRRSIGFRDDSQITQIHAERVVNSGDRAWYEVEINTE